jgi:hypothetical protein
VNPTPRSPFAALRRFTQPAPTVERCGLCGEPLPPEHAHLCEPTARRLVCACQACALLLGSESGRFRRVPSRLESLPELRLADTQLAALGVPVGLAFFYRASATGSVVAVYPSPAGPLESPVEAEAWESLAADNPVLRELEPDVEALLVNRVRGSRAHYRCSIDRCYHLIGLVRTHWRGFTGGPELWSEVEAYFARLRAEAKG